MAVTIDELQIEIQAKGAESASGIGALTTSLGALKRMINKSLVGKLESLSSALDGIKAPITVNMNVKGMEGLRNAVQAATAGMPTNAANISPAVDGSAVASEMNRIKASTEQAADGFATITSEATRAKQELKSAGDAAGDAGKKLKEVGTSAKRGASGLNKFVSSLKRIALYRAIRSILKTITSAIKEGTQNLVRYSAAIGGIDASRANATMSQFASAGMQVKNSIGAALMPVLNALMPVIQTLANWFIIAANAVNQFFAAISGASMWTKAKEYAVDYADGLGKAAGAASGLKNAMLGIDELNVISPPGGGGGGGAGALDYENMFEESDISGKIAEIADKIKPVIGWVKDNLDIVKGLAIGISAALLGWKLAGGFSGSIKKLIGNLKGIAAGMLTIVGAAALVGGAFDAWVNGVDWQNLLFMIGGTAAIVAGLAIKFGVVGVAIGLLIGGITALVVGIKDWIKTGELSTQTFAALEFGILAVGGALALLISPWALVVAAVGAAALAIYKYWDEIKLFLSNTWASIRTGIETAWNGIGDFFTTTWGNIKSAASTTWSNMKTTIGTAWDNIKSGTSEKWNAIRSNLSTTWSNIKSNASTDFNSMKTNIATIWDDAKSNTSTTWNTVKSSLSTTWNSIKSTADSVFGSMKTSVANIWDNLWSSLKGTINAIIGGVEKMANGVISGINGMIRALNRINFSIPEWVPGLGGKNFGFNLSTISNISIPRYEFGGYPVTGQMFLAREAGPEMVGTMGGRTAVANNDQIVEGIREGVYDAVVAANSMNGGRGDSFKFEMEGREITTRVTKRQTSMERMYGRA